MSNITSHIASLKLDELQDILKNIKVYQSLSKSLGQRGRSLYHKKQNNTKQYSIEYYPSISQQSAWEQAERVYKEVLNEVPNKAEVQFLEKPELKGGMKVYADDTMVDLSYNKIEQQIQ